MYPVFAAPTGTPSKKANFDVCAAPTSSCVSVAEMLALKLTIGVYYETQNCLIF